MVRAGSFGGNQAIISPASPTKTLTLAQAQQMGLVPSGAVAGSPSKVRSIRISSPVKGQSANQVRQIVIRPPDGQGQIQLGGQPQQPQQQVLRIPASSAPGLAAGSIQQIQVGNKIQYVRVLGSEAAAAATQVKVISLMLESRSRVLFEIRTRSKRTYVVSPRIEVFAIFLK